MSETSVGLLHLRSPSANGNNGAFDVKSSTVPKSKSVVYNAIIA